MASLPAINNIRINGKSPYPPEFALDMQADKKVLKHRIVCQGAHIQVFRPQSQPRKKPIRKRGAIKKFSNQSRDRLIKKMLILDWDSIEIRNDALFMTLTTPPEWWERYETLYEKLNNLRRFLKAHGAIQVYVKRELGALNGAHHFHLLVFFEKGKALPVEPEGEQGGIIQKHWGRALGIPEIRSSVEIPENWDECKVYITKYVSKIGYEGAAGTREYLQRVAAGVALESEKSSACHNSHNATKCTHQGKRWWYIWGQGSLPEASEVVKELNPAEIKQVHRIRRVWRGVLKGRIRKKIKDRLNYDENTITKHWKNDRNYKYYNRGSFTGWRIWCNEPDIQVLFKLLSPLIMGDYQK